MHLLIFIHSLSSGGAERVTSNLANYWAKKGWDITIVTVTGCESDFYEIHPNISRIPLELDARSNNLFEAIKHNYTRIKALRRILTQHKPDVALSMMTTANIILGLATLRLGIASVGSERIHPPMLPLGTSWEWLRRQSYRQLNAVVALSTESANWLDEHTNAQQTNIIPNAVNYPITRHSPLVEPNMGRNNCFTLIAVGRLSPQKGFDRLLTAFSTLASRFPDWNLAIIGEGECRIQLEQQKHELGLNQRVSMPGAVGNLGDWYEAADLFVMTSLFEGFPNTLAEAMAYGLPVISVDCDTGPRDIIRDRIDGVLIPQDNQQALVNALAELMANQELRQHYAERAVEIRERFSMDTIASAWEELFIALTHNEKVSKEP
ncbi:MAG: glycosyltransferase family 4 protein [Pseudomonadales bacterium]|nr:glycosyltransferase family 4 protein [Pseudomonadales bacterium]